MNDFTDGEVQLLRIAIKQFARNTTKFGYRAEWELDKSEEESLINLIRKFNVNIDFDIDEDDEI
jgi:hypothetical protein